MDLKGMTIPEKLDILYAGANWLNDDGTAKERYEDLQRRYIGQYIKDHIRLLEDLLEDNTNQQLADSLKIKASTLASYIHDTRHSEEKQGQPIQRKRRKRNYQKI